MAQKFRIPKYVEFPVVSIFPPTTTGFKMEVTYVAEGRNHRFTVGSNAMTIYKRIQDKYRWSPDFAEKMRQRAIQGDFVLRFTPNDRDMYIVKLIDKKNKRMFTLIGDRYGTSGYGYTENKDHIYRAFFENVKRP